MRNAIDRKEKRFLIGMWLRIFAFGVWLSGCVKAKPSSLPQVQQKAQPLQAVKKGLPVSYARQRVQHLTQKLEALRGLQASKNFSVQVVDRQGMKEVVQRKFKEAMSDALFALQLRIMSRLGILPSTGDQQQTLFDFYAQEAMFYH